MYVIMYVIMYVCLFVCMHVCIYVYVCFQNMPKCSILVILGNPGLGLSSRNIFGQNQIVRAGLARLDKPIAATTRESRNKAPMVG